MSEDKGYPPTQVRRIGAEGETPGEWLPLASFDGAPQTRAHKVWMAVTADLARDSREGEVEVDGVKYQYRPVPQE